MDPGAGGLNGWFTVMKNGDTSRAKGLPTSPKNADASFSCLDSDESRHCATHLPVREFAYGSLPRRDPTRRRADSLQSREGRYRI